MEKERFVSKRAFSQTKRFSQVVKYGDVAYISGQVSMNLETGEFLGGNMESQTTVVLQTIKNILEDMGLGLNSILMINCFISDINKISEMNKVYEEFFNDVEILPARCTVQASMGEYDIEMYATIGLNIK